MLFFLVKALLISIDFFLTLVTFGWIGAVKKRFKKKGFRSVPVNDDPSHRKDATLEGPLLTKPSDDISTLYELFDVSTKRFLHRNCLGSREFLKDLGKVKEFGPNTVWLTYGEVREKALKFGAALRGSGLVPGPKQCTLDKITGPYSLAIFENTCAQWIVGALGAFTQSISVTTIYATLGMDAVIDAINDGIIAAIMCNQEHVDLILSRISETPTLKTIIYTNNMIEPDTCFQPKYVPSDMTVVSFDDFVDSGKTSSYPPTPPVPDTCAVVMYTSGSTGKPKGVVIKHSNVVSSVAAMVRNTELNKDDVYLGYLPLAHILELTAEVSTMTIGAKLCFADPKTLTTSGSRPIGALEQFKPTCMAGVPKIWDVIKKGAQAKIDSGSPLERHIAMTAFQAKKFAMEHGFDTPLFNLLVFNKFKQMVGGRMRMCLSGGGAISEESQIFIRTAFGIPCVQGYGLTETVAGTSIQKFDDMRPGVVGPPLPCNEVRMVSCPEFTDKANAPYLSTDRFDSEGNPIYGRGEIEVKGGNIAVGYYMQPEKTAEVFLSDGFFQTGDIGQFMIDGSIRIVDRKKNIVKLRGGEYVAIARMELVYSNSEFVDPIAGGLTCHGDGDMDRPIALLHINPISAKKWAAENGVPYDLEELKKNKKFYDTVYAEMKKLHKESDLTNLEKVVAIGFAGPEHWTPENGCLTAANKLNRNGIFELEKAVFEETRKKAIF